MGLPVYYYPRAIVVLDCLFDDQVGGPGIPAKFAAIPRSVEVERNSARRADAARVELDYRDFPLDPRILKDVVLSVHIAALASALLPTVPSPLNRRFIGRVDEPDADLGRDEQTVRLEARDYTGIWLDTRWPAGKTIPTPKGATLQVVVESLRLQVTPFMPPAVFTDPVAAATFVCNRTGRSVFTPRTEDDNAWDVLSAICDLFGLVPSYELEQLTIRTAATVPTGGALMVYGQNVERLQFKRSLKQQKGKQIKVVAWNPVLGQSLEAVYPPATGVPALGIPPPVVTRKHPAKGGTSVAKPTVEQVQYSVEGPYDPATLLQLAQRVYEESAQDQLAGELQTGHMRDLLGGDLLTLKNGDQLICQLAPQDQASIASMSPAEAVAFLSNPAKPNHLDPTVASALVSAWTQTQALSITFYISEVLHRWDRNDGYRISIRFRDFVLGA